jgi:hypothetical protein
MEQAPETIACAALIMNSIKLVLLIALSGAAALSGADLAGVHTVYMMPMAHGLEQYLANTLTTEHVFVIVTDPKKADAVLTDHIGVGLEEKLDSMLKAPPPEKSDAAAGAKDDAKDHKSSLAEPENKLDNPATNSTVGHGKGTIFLLDTKSRQVVWSTYELPKDSTSKESDRIASAIVSRLRKDMGLTKK